MLSDITDAYNRRQNSALYGLSPYQAHELKNEEFLRAKFLEGYKKHKLRYKNQKPRFKVGDSVRIVRDSHVFNRGYEPYFSREIFTIKAIKKTYPITYELTGKQRSFYQPELVAAKPAITPEEKDYFIEKTRTIHAKKLRSGALTSGEKQYLLRSKNDKDLSTWISEFEFLKLKNGGYLV